jgi:biotin operon repressor
MKNHKAELLDLINEGRHTTRHLAKVLGISRDAVKRTVQNLREDGVLIQGEVSGPQRGYKVIKTEEELERFIDINSSRMKHLNRIILMAKAQRNNLPDTNQINIMEVI